MNFSKRRTARMHCVVSLYIYQLGNIPIEEILAGYLKHQENLGVMADEKVYSFYEELLKKTLENISMIDEEITKASKKWDTSRIFPIDKAILRMSICEMLVIKHASIPIIINEAIELAKTYSPDEEKGPKFINGVLDTVAELAKLK